MEPENSLVVERLNDWDDLLALEPEWRTLEASSALPFHSFDWLIPWWEHFREDKLGIRDDLYVHTVRRRDGSLAGIAPMVLTRRPSWSPVALRQVHFFGADPNITELRGVVADPADRDDVYSAVATHLRAHSDEWDWALLSGLPSGTAAGELEADDRLHFEWVKEVPAYVLDVPTTWDGFRCGLPRNIKESLRKCYNSLKRDGLDFHLEVCRGEVEVAWGLERFFDLHSARAGADVAVQHRDLFGTETERRFLREVCTRFARRGALRIFLLHVGASVVAARLGFRVGDTMYLYYSGYDPAFARYSVMTTTVAESVKAAIAEGCRKVNLSTGRDVAKTRWRPSEVVYRDGLLVSPSLRSAVAHGVFRHTKEGLTRYPLLALAARSLRRRGNDAVAAAQRTVVAAE